MSRRIPFGLPGWLLLSALAAVWAGACGEETLGGEGDTCKTAGDCMAGLVCENNTCVRPEETCTPACNPEIEACFDGECHLVVDPGDMDGDESRGDNDCKPFDRTVHPGAFEYCDGVDNDCDGQIDEDCPACKDGEKSECGDGVGECSTGTMSCVGGRWQACSGQVPRPERCDGLDNDCDGLIDEICPCHDGEESDCSLEAGICLEGVMTCNEGEWTDCITEVVPDEEKCDGEDNDCDGLTDEGFNLGTPCDGGEDGCGDGSIECAGERGMICSTALGSSQLPVLMTDDFQDLNMDGWNVLDQGGTTESSAWDVNEEGWLFQGGNIHGGAACETRRGSIAFWDNSTALAWQDYRFTVTAYSKDNDGIGVVFRYQDADNFYRLDLDNDTCTSSRLSVINGGVENTIGFRDGPGFTQSIGTTIIEFTIEVRVRGGEIIVRKDGAVLFEVSDGTLAKGTVGLYTWGNDGAFFDNVVVVSQTCP